MKIKINLLLTAMFAFFLCSCSEINPEIELIETGSVTRYETAHITNPFSENDEESEVDGEENKSELILNYGWGINIENVEHLNYENNNLVVPIKVENLGTEFEVGFLIYADGILQQYSSNVSEEKSNMQILTVHDGTKADVEESFEFYLNELNVSDNNDEHKISVISIVNPLYQPEAYTILGANHSGTGINPIPVITDSDVSVLDFGISDKYESHIITDDEIRRFWIDTESKYTYVKMFLCPENSDNSPDWILPASTDGTQHLKFYMYSQNAGIVDYRVSFYKNNELIKFNSGDEYIDLTLKDKYLNTAEITVDNVKEGDYIYCIAVPLNASTNALKMSDILFISEEEMLPPASAVCEPMNPDELNTEIFDESE